MKIQTDTKPRPEYTTQACFKRAEGRSPFMLKFTRADRSFGFPVPHFGLTVLEEGGSRLRIEIEDMWCEIKGSNLEKLETLLHYGLLAEIICHKPNYKEPPRREESRDLAIDSIRFYRYSKKDIIELYPQT